MNVTVTVKNDSPATDSRDETVVVHATDAKAPVNIAPGNEHQFTIEDGNSIKVERLSA